ncbi:hypothetical protein LL3_00399 [Bacillus amyloliquefaciens LL3]|nr:hypothetical protein LL3_00399 [Bacillus amyloliquefaciens LL3]
MRIKRNKRHGILSDTFFLFNTVTRTSAKLPFENGCIFFESVLY